MKIEVRYFSKTGNTKKIANAIAEELGIEAKDINTPLESADILFLGGAPYAGSINRKLKKFINELDNKTIKKVAIFTTSGQEDVAYKEMKKYIEEKSISVSSDYFYCLAKFFIFFLKDRPNEKDLEDAKAFARRIVKK